MMFPQPNDVDPSFFPFSSPTLNYGSLDDIFFSSSAAAANKPAVAEAAVPEKTTSSRDKPTRKDRHRKIDTAKGPRDRRMRLSLDVARKFFDLQDLLAFDKASKTVQWLLNKSKSAIKEQVQAASKGKSTSDYAERKSLPEPPLVSKRALAVRNMRSRECRDKARARARERTLEKKKKMSQRGRQDEGSEGSKEPLPFNATPQEESSLDEHCSITSPIFDYNVDDVENFFLDSWEISYGTLIIPPVFDHV